MDLTEYLQGRGYKVDSLHGDKTQQDRERSMRAFRDKKVNILVCTDVASRGLDVKELTHVINYSIPKELDAYVHRIGRTARSGVAGMAISLVSPTNRYMIERIERLTKSKMHEGKVPSRRDLGEKKVAKLLERFLSTKHHARAAEMLGAEWQSAVEEMDLQEIIARFIAMTAPEIFEDPVAHKPLSTAPRPAHAKPSYHARKHS
jgi:ATP-dependent RNA helicase DeaD